MYINLSRARNNLWSWSLSFQAMSKFEMKGGRFRYIVGHRRLDVPDAQEQREEVFDVTQSELVISNQDTFRQYEVYVLAANEVGLSSVEPDKMIVHSGQASESEVPRIRNLHCLLLSISLQFVCLCFFYQRLG